MPTNAWSYFYHILFLSYHVLFLIAILQLSSHICPRFLIFIILILILGELFTTYTVQCVHPSHDLIKSYVHMLLDKTLTSTMCSNILSLLRESEQIKHPYKRAGKIVVSHNVYECKVYVLPNKLYTRQGRYIKICRIV